MPEASPRIVKFTPTSYKEQAGLTCGEYNVRGILEGFQIPYQPLQKPPLRVRWFGFSFMDDISSLLQNHGLKAPVQFAGKMTDQDRLKLITGHLDRDEPLLVAIGNGHLARDRYSRLARFFVGHFITIFGYDPQKKIFFIYDPYLKGAYQETIPAGNDIRSFQELLSAWNGPFYYPWINMDHVYIPVSAAGEDHNHPLLLGYKASQ